MSSRDFLLPQFGNGPETAEIVEWHVRIDQRVHSGDIIASLDIGDVVVEVAATCAGTINHLCGDEGDFVTVGERLIVLSDIEGEVSTTELTLIDGSSDNLSDDLAEQGSMPVAPGAAELAKQLRLELESISTKDASGIITIEDVERAIEEQATPATSDWQQLEGARKAMSARLSLAARDAVPAMLTATADIGHWPDDASVTVRMIQTIASVVHEWPALNSSYDSTRDALCGNARVNLGIVGDVDDGHIVPVINDASALDADALRDALNTIEKATRERALDPEQLQGATITLAVLEGLGAEYAQLPIISPQVAAIAVGKTRAALKLAGDEMRITRSLPISLTFDHRVISLNEAGAFLKGCIRELENDLGGDAEAA